MSVTWPDELQQLLDQDSFSYSIGDTSIKSDMEIGPPKVRRRFTKSTDAITCQIRIDYSQFQYLYDFWDVTLNGGVTPFIFNNPFTQVAETFRMDTPPSLKPMGGNCYQVAMQWIRLPQ